MKRLLFLSIILISAFSFKTNAQNCSADYRTSINGLTVDFNDTSSANSTITSYFWTFGDGDSSTVTNPTHTYSNSGRYKVCLTIESALRCTDTFCDSVQVTAPCTADYTYTVDTLNNVSFTNLSSTLSIAGNGYSYKWSFGDNSSIDTSIHPVHQYNSAGQYGVSLTIIGNGDSCFYYDTVYVNDCSASFATTVDTATVHFSNFSTSSKKTNYSWNFGDGNFSNIKAPTHTYLKSGTYTIVLNSYDSLSNCSATFTDSVTISLPQNCLADFGYTITNDTISITSMANNYTNLIYYFGDGDSSIAENPTHKYDQNGSYIITQTVFDSLSLCNNSSSDTILINVPSVINCTSGFSTIIRNDTVDFIDSLPSFDSLVYEFGDGQFSTQNNPSHIYDSSGSYLVCQTVFDTLRACSSTTCKTISVTVPAPCKAGFDQQVIGDSILFTNTATSYNRVEYDFGDNNTSTEEDPYHLYVNSGTYYVSQTAYNDARNCSDTFYDTIIVNISTSCFADFVVAIDTTKSKLLFLINYSSSHPNHKYNWTFGDGDTGVGRTPSHLYTDYGKYEICLTVSDSVLGCTSTYCDSLGLDSNNHVLKANGFTLQVIDGRPIGIEENLLEAGLSIYPNPVDERLNIVLPKTTLKVTYRLLDITGKTLGEGILNEQSNQLDFSEYNKGIYLIQFTDGRNVAVKRVIKR